MDEDAIDGGIVIEFFDFCQQLCLACIRGQLELYRMQAKFPAHPVLRADISSRCWIVAHKHNGKAGRDLFPGQIGDPMAQLCVNFFGDRAPIDQLIAAHRNLF